MKYEEALKQLELFSQTKNLSAFEQVADEIERHREQLKEEEYFSLMLQICNLFNSVNFDDYDRRVALRQKYAALALEKSAQIPLDIEVPLLIHAQQDAASTETSVTVEEWAARRSKTAEAWLRVWQRIEREMDKDFDFKDVPLENVATPGAHGLAGMSPEYIADPALRAEYEAAIEQNRLKAETYRHQRNLSDLYQMFSSTAEKYLVNAYSRPPFDVEELNRYLETYIAAQETRERILEAVKQGMSNASG